MRNLGIRILINTIALIVAAQIVPNLNLELGSDLQSWLQVAAIALVFGIINSFLKPIVKLLTLPLTIVTLGLIGIVINGAMLLVLSIVCDWLNLPFDVAGWPGEPFRLDTIIAAVLGAIVVGIVAAIAGHFLDGDR